ncbi:hypothetical protein CEXT_498551 [Caerostris extrusa]|uniref:Uncharacterized protein n=1 Tax=Caerostris extrusa TaxID=172846 RepID=A0AAV4TF47_CAEEX|nr:hypothetical protein CEXT_498551 [Caerostris extrusa]
MAKQGPQKGGRLPITTQLPLFTGPHNGALNGVDLSSLPASRDSRLFYVTTLHNEIRDCTDPGLLRKCSLKPYESSSRHTGRDLNVEETEPALHWSTT